MVNWLKKFVKRLGEQVKDRLQQCFSGRRIKEF